MDMTRHIDVEQHAVWNGVAGGAWVEAQELLDRVFRPFEELLVEATFAGSACHVLDVGCGTGSRSLTVARRLGANGSCTGIDISEPMIGTARLRAEREGNAASFICADAGRYAFEESAFDAIISRFGVMFFDDAVRAFANLRRAARSGAELRCIAWRTPDENPFMTTAERAAAPLLPIMPQRCSDEPGQFAFADALRVRRILEQSGWREIEIRPIDVACTFPEKELVYYLTRLGPLGRILPEVDDQTRAQVIKTVRAAFEPFVFAAEVRFDTACWVIGARAPSSSTPPKDIARV